VELVEIVVGLDLPSKMNHCVCPFEGGVESVPVLYRAHVKGVPQNTFKRCFGGIRHASADPHKLDFRVDGTLFLQPAQQCSSYVSAGSYDYDAHLSWSFR
jgi:hypothetical protein